LGIVAVNALLVTDTVAVVVVAAIVV